MTTLLALLLSATLVLAYEYFQYRQEKVESLLTQADVLSHSVAPALIFKDPLTAKQQLVPLAHQKGLQHAAVYDSAGRVFAQYPAAPYPGAVQPPSQLASPQWHFSWSELEVFEPVMQDGEQVGIVQIRLAHDLLARLGSYVALQGGVLLLSLACAITVFARLQRRVTEPMARVTEVASEVIERRDWSLRARPERNEDVQRLVHSFNAMLDEVQARTETLQREMEVRQKAEESLLAADRRKDEFLATLAHELRNPLAPMTNAVMLLGRESTPAAGKQKAVAILDRQLRHLVRLIDDLLDVSRISTGKLVLQQENIDLGTVLHSAVELIEPVARERRLRLDVALPDVPCVLVGDSARLLQVVSNLLTNACRYTPPGGLVELRVAQAPSYVEVSVRDTGIGIEASMQERIFELFEQGDKSLERGNVGLGLGLTLAKRLAQMHGGDVGVSSKGIGHGSTFVVKLPRPEGEISISNSAGAALTTPGAALRLLIADDNVDFASSLEVLLVQSGHSVRVVHDGQAALDAAHLELPDVLLLDIGMPKLNGYEVAERLRAESSSGAKPVLIAISGWGQPADKARAASAGFDHHLLKPVDAEKLRQLLALIAEGRAVPSPQSVSVPVTHPPACL
ncbi:ATP-binding protein [Azohydromonas aeria]|uniref:ATP-binding protein n=1 Tax=Azohydromonas aeria TaxID=2590212 RepID=UPI0018E03ECE|nr:ATP-binding protein [Azohydromonas aeria]